MKELEQKTKKEETGRLGVRNNPFEQAGVQKP